jgi:hypothetical protein
MSKKQIDAKKVDKKSQTQESRNKSNPDSTQVEMIHEEIVFQNHTDLRHKRETL